MGEWWVGECGVAVWVWVSTKQQRRGGQHGGSCWLGRGACHVRSEGDRQLEVDQGGVGLRLRKHGMCQHGCHPCNGKHQAQACPSVASIQEWVQGVWVRQGGLRPMLLQLVHPSAGSCYCRRCITQDVSMHSPCSTPGCGRSC